MSWIKGYSINASTKIYLSPSRSFFCTFPASDRFSIVFLLITCPTKVIFPFLDVCSNSQFMLAINKSSVQNSVEYDALDRMFNINSICSLIDVKAAKFCLNVLQISAPRVVKEYSNWCFTHGSTWPNLFQHASFPWFKWMNIPQIGREKKWFHNLKSFTRHAFSRLDPKCLREGRSNDLVSSILDRMQLFLVFLFIYDQGRRVAVR